MRTEVAALYVETGGVYFGLDSVDPWAEHRDARNYEGPWPVVAHPPCARWCLLAPLVESMYGYKVGDDGGTFAAALNAVRTYGGVLEHPAYSLAWSAFQLPVPVRGTWSRTLFDDGWATEVSQVAYGHAARKRTWLYYVGDVPPPDLDWSEPPALTVVSDLGATRGGKKWDEWNGSVQHADASRSPLAFRDTLLSIARGSRGETEAIA